MNGSLTLSAQLPKKISGPASQLDTCRKKFSIPVSHQRAHLQHIATSIDGLHSFSWAFGRNKYFFQMQGL